MAFGVFIIQIFVGYHIMQIWLTKELTTYKISPHSNNPLHLPSCLFKYCTKCNENELPGEIGNPLTCRIFLEAMWVNGLNIVQS